MIEGQHEFNTNILLEHLKKLDDTIADLNVARPVQAEAATVGE